MLVVFSIKIANVDIPTIIGIFAYVHTCHEGAISVSGVYPVRLIIVCRNNIKDMSGGTVIFIGITVVKSEGYKQYQ